ncbi:hypothetical protein [Paenibacillus pabuli]|uniref:hypothetical protein n=1 Tax=Paenibacillus pabuli TaxID=1472 RepID=UPI003CEFF2C7
MRKITNLSSKMQLMPEGLASLNAITRCDSVVFIDSMFEKMSEKLAQVTGVIVQAFFN